MPSHLWCALNTEGTVTPAELPQPQSIRWTMLQYHWLLRCEVSGGFVFELPTPFLYLHATDLASICFQTNHLERRLPLIVPAACTACAVHHNGRLGGWRFVRFRRMCVPAKNALNTTFIGCLDKSVSVDKPINLMKFIQCLKLWCKMNNPDYRRRRVFIPNLFRFLDEPMQTNISSITRIVNYALPSMTKWPCRIISVSQTEVSRKQDQHRRFFW